MAASFVRRFLTQPDIATLLEIEAVNVLDLEPPSELSGVGSGTVLIVGEFENGPFTQQQITSGNDFKNTYGTLGYEYDGVLANNPCARSRKADSQLKPEFWNGNGFIAAANKKFNKLICLRVDTSVGTVDFTRHPALYGSSAASFALVPAQTLVFDIGGGPLTATFNATHAITTSAAGVFPTTFVGGEKMNVTIDGGTPQQIGPVDIIFSAADQSHAQLVARINTVLGYTAAAISGADTTLTGRLLGTAGSVVINSIDALVATASGFAAGTSNGTGNVADISNVLTAEVHTIVHAVTAHVSADRDASGDLRFTNTVDATLAITNATTALGLGFTIPSSSSSAAGNDGTIPAGTRVRDVGAHEWVTMQDLAITAANAGPYTVKVRPATDDGTGVSALFGAVNVVPFPIALDFFTVTNSVPLTAAKTESQIDALYVTAIQGTTSLVQPAAKDNIVVSARASNIIRSTMKDNAIDASANGCFGRIAVVRPALGTTRAIATGAGQPSVKAYRDRRVVYAYPGVQTYISQIASRGAVAGGAGFTDSGIIDSGFDTFVASTMSQLAPEENPGQQTTFLDGVLGIEAANTDVQDMGIGDYIIFKANGIAAPRVSDGEAVIQSGCTSVDPLINPGLRNIARQRMADFIQDTLALRLVAFGKKLNTRSRRAALVSEIRSFLNGLLLAERIAGFSLDLTGNTASQLALGIFRIIINVQTLSSLDAIVLATTIGESVQIAQAA